MKTNGILKEHIQVKKTKLQYMTEYGEKLKAVFELEIDPLVLYNRIRRIELFANRQAVKYANGEYDGFQYDVQVNEIIKRLAKVIGKEKLELIFVNSDCRGYSLKFKEEISRNLYIKFGINTDWGGYGILAKEF